METYLETNNLKYHDYNPNIGIKFIFLIINKNLTNMSYLFSETALESISFSSNKNTQNVTNMSHMFEGCIWLKSANLSNWNTKNVTDMSHMFKGCK